MSNRKLHLINISRPRFWIYLLGPFVVGVAAGWQGSLEVWAYVLIAMFFLYFTFPGNFLVYGVNDVFDWETDRRNKKKQSYESLLPKAYHGRVLWLSALMTLPVVALSFFSASSVIIGMTTFVLLGVGYSAPPIRAKVRPVIDSLFNGLYVMPGLVGYGLMTSQFPEPLLIAAAWIWSAAMHAYSAIPDIEADTRAQLKTIATVLGSKGTIGLCALLYLLAAVFSYSTLGWFAVFAAAVYLGLMAVSLNRSSKQLMSVYKWFPFVNTVIGFGLFVFAIAS